MSYETAIATLGELLGRKKKAATARPKKTSAKDRLKKAVRNVKVKAKIRKLVAKRPSAKKPLMKAAWGRLTPLKKKAVIANAIRKNPALKKKLALAVVKKRIEDRKNGTVTSPGAVSHTPVPARASTAIMPDPASASIPEEETMSTAQAVEQEMEQGPLDSAAEDTAAEEEAGEEAAQETAAEMYEEAEADGENMSEESPEEAAEEAQDVAEEAADAVSESAGDLLLGWVKGKRRQQRRHDGHVRDCVQKATPLAGEIERLSGGSIETAHLLGAVKLIAKAKKGDVKAKKGIKAVTKLAVKKGPKQKVAKKAVAKLKIAHTIMKKTGTAKGTTPKKKAVIKRKVAKKAAYSKKVTVRSKGLDSYSAYQRGMAQIPGVARTYFGT
jgi:hypothetical protein